MAQTFLFGAYKFPREMTWTTGILCARLLLSEWDLPGSYSGGIQRRRGRSWSRLSRQGAFRLSVTGWPALSLAVIRLAGRRLVGSSPSSFRSAWNHVWLYRVTSVARPSPRDVGASGCRQTSRPGNVPRGIEELLKKSGKPFWPDLAWRDVIVVTGLIIAIAVAAFFVGPPALDKPPDPSVLAADPRPDWYFFGTSRCSPSFLTRSKAMS